MWSGRSSPGRITTGSSKIGSSTPSSAMTPILGVRRPWLGESASVDRLRGGRGLAGARRTRRVESYTSFVIVAAIAFVAPLIRGMVPQILVPAIVLELVAGIIVGPHGLGIASATAPVEVFSTVGPGLPAVPGRAARSRSSGCGARCWPPRVAGFAISFALAFGARARPARGRPDQDAAAGGDRLRRHLAEHHHRAAQGRARDRHRLGPAGDRGGGDRRVRGGHPALVLLLGRARRGVARRSST